MENKDVNTVWNNFDDIHPEPNRKIKVDLGGDIFDSETKMLENAKEEIYLWLIWFNQMVAHGL
jgi:hypothetical protein